MDNIFEKIEKFIEDAAIKQTQRILKENEELREQIEGLKDVLVTAETKALNWENTANYYKREFNSVLSKKRCKDERLECLKGQLEDKSGALSLCEGRLKHAEKTINDIWDMVWKAGFNEEAALKNAVAKMTNSLNAHKAQSVIEKEQIEELSGKVEKLESKARGLAEENERLLHIMSGQREGLRRAYMEEAENIYSQAVETWGIDAQAVKAIEEMGELTTELARYINAPDGNGPGERNFRHHGTRGIIEEIADVMITVEQLRLWAGAGKVDDVIKFKLERLKVMIAGAKGQ